MSTADTYVAASEGLDDADLPRYCRHIVDSERNGTAIEEWAAAYLLGRIRSERRARTLEIERAAEKQARVDPRLDENGVMHGLTSRRQLTAPARRSCECPRCAEGRTTFAREESVREDRDRESQRSFSTKLGALIDDYVADLRIRWTTELLDAEFALPNGDRVRWGDATIEQHRERHRMLLRNAVSNAEAAARHNAAIRDMQTGGAATLRELVGVSA